MTKYITVANRPNKIATIHLATCRHLGPEPLAQTSSADRLAFDDGLDAIVAARNAMSSNFGFCGHCLPAYRWLLPNKILS